MSELIDFIKESNRIEGLHGLPSTDDIEAHVDLLNEELITVQNIKTFVDKICGGKLRDQPGMDVFVGKHRPIPGGPDVFYQLSGILFRMRKDPSDACVTHHEYERVHPFMDGNGRSGRAIWLWQHSGKAPLGFLHQFYYESLMFGDQRKALRP